MKFYLARLRREYPCGSRKFMDYYFKHSSLEAARRKVRKRYAKWHLVSLRSVGTAEVMC